MAETPTTIEILGPGCRRCQETHRVVASVVAESGLACEVVKVESIDRMVELGIMATPAVAFDGRVVMAGRIPTPEEVRTALGLA